MGATLEDIRSNAYEVLTLAATIAEALDAPGALDVSDAEAPWFWRSCRGGSPNAGLDRGPPPKKP